MLHLKARQRIFLVYKENKPITLQKNGYRYEGAIHKKEKCEKMLNLVYNKIHEN